MATDGEESDTASPPPPEPSRSASQESTTRPESTKESIVTSSQINSPLIVTTPTKTPDSGPRSALFDDHVASAHVPGSLHLAPDSTIQRLVERQGYIPLIRQLAEDLAHRDKELVNFRRRAEERERALRRMLLEVEVSNADIEKRLASAVLQTKQSRETMKSGDGMSYTESIDDMMQQALSEEDAYSFVDDLSGLNISMEEEDAAEDLVTPRATFRAPRDTDSVSLHSNTSRRSSTVRGWKSYFMGSGAENESRTRRQSFGGTAKRKSISPETFSPPPEGSQAIPPKGSRASISSAAQARSVPPSTTYTQPHLATDKSQPKVPRAPPSSGKPPDPKPGQRRTSNSVAHWALRAVSTTTEQDDPSSKIHSPTPTRSRPQEVLSESLKRRPSPGIAANGRSRSGSTSTPAKTTFFQEIRDTAERIVPLGGGPSTSTKPEDAGPVEMDMIIPHEAQPPTLLQGWHQQYPGDFLTDRFGFIYNKQQRTVSIKGANSIEGTYTERKPPDETAKRDSSAESLAAAAKAAVKEVQLSETVYGPTTLADVPLHLSTSLPMSSSTDSLTASRGGTVIQRLSRPGEPVASPTMATNAVSETTLPNRNVSTSGSSLAEESTVRLLLGQLSDLHDSLQRDRAVKWNEFLRKVRVERRRTEDDEKGMPEAMMADGELIGVATLGTEGRGGKQRWKEFKNLVLGGIPVTYRWKIWTECSGATAMKVPGYYEDLLQQDADDPIVISQIAMDINRTLTDNIFFRKGPGVSKLKQVLLAYSRRNREVGYCQGMNMIAASLLLIMPSEEDAFWVLCSIVERILPKTYFEPNLLASRADQEVLKHYVATILPVLHAHLTELGVELEALSFQWFLSIFTDTLAAEALFRVWDVVLCVAGSVFLFQVAIALLRLNEKALLRCDSAAEVYSYLHGGMIHQGISIDGLIRESDALKAFIKYPEVEKRRERAVKKELGERGDRGKTPEHTPEVVDEGVEVGTPVHEEVVA